MNTLILENILACPMCMSGAEGKSLLAANSAIGVMLFFLLSMLGSFFAFIIYLARRSRKIAEELPGENN